MSADSDRRPGLSGCGCRKWVARRRGRREHVARHRRSSRWRGERGSDEDDLVDGREVLRTDDLERREMMAVQLDEAREFLARRRARTPAWRSSSSTTRLR